MPLYVTVQEFKQEYKSTAHTVDDAFIARALQAAQDALDAWLDRTVIATADTTEYFDFAGEEIDGLSLWLDMRGDISSITTVTNGDATTLVEGTDFEVYPKTLSTRRPTLERIKILASVSKTWELPTTNDPENAISIAGKWAMWNTVASVPEEFKLSVMELTAHAIESRKSQIFDTTAIPDAGVITIPSGWPANVARRLRGYRRLGVS